MSVESNKLVVEQLWDALYKKDWERLMSVLSEDAHYEDVPTPDPGADGPANIVKRLRIGLDPVVRFEHEWHRVVGEGDSIILEHTEVWHFETGESMRNQFVTIHEIVEGKIRLWRDYWDVNTMMAQLPKWFLERLANYSEADFEGSE